MGGRRVAAGGLRSVGRQGGNRVSRATCLRLLPVPIPKHQHDANDRQIHTQGRGPADPSRWASGH